MPVLPDAIERFLRTHITSVDHLDLLVLLVNSPETEWTVEAAAQVVHGRPDQAEACLERLVTSGLAAVRRTPEPRYRSVAPRGPLAADTAVMVAFYRERPVSVIRRIYEQGSDGLRAFADAFKIRPPE